MIIKNFNYLTMLGKLQNVLKYAKSIYMVKYELRRDYIALPTYSQDQKEIFLSMENGAYQYSFGALCMRVSPPEITQ